MNIKHYLSAVAAIFVLVACSDYDPGMSENVEDYTVEELAFLKEYEAYFVERYGEIDPNHTWGFGEKGSEDEMMETRSVNVNRNEWDHAVKEDGRIVDYTTWTNAEGKTMVVPGFPSTVDNLYHIEDDVPTGNVITDEWGTHPEYETKNMAYTKQQLIDKGRDSYNPVGDVTDEEIQYVSEWFRTHRDPDSELPPFTEFFIQEISKDKDRVIEGTGKTATANGAWVDWQHIPTVWADDKTNAGSEPIDFSMDYLAVETSSAPREHLNNYNSGNTNPIAATPPTNLATDTQEFPYRTLKYWTSNGGYTTDFVTHASGDNTDYKHYVLVHLTFDGPRTGYHYDGYYLAFDYELYKSTTVYDGNTGRDRTKITEIKPDGFYSNWIVKLSPADPDWKEEKHTWYRIMCEDLGNTYDYDFNDLVYDVYFTGTAPNYEAHIKVQAVGGTLPIYINDQELHELLGASVRPDGLYNPINVGGEKRSPQYMVLSMSTTDPDDIAIVVPASGKNRKNNDFTLPKSNGGTTVSQAPQKICIPGNTTKWMKESKQIETSYLNFDKWVNKENDTKYGFNGTEPWNTYSGGINTGNLYNP